MTITDSRTPGPVLHSAGEVLTAARRIADDLRPGASGTDRAGSVPPAILDAVRAAGLLTINVPAAHGGAGASNRTVIEVLRTLATGDPSVALLVFVHYTIIYALTEQGSPELQEKIFADVLRGARIGNAAAERGTPQAGLLKTRITVGDDGAWRLTGRKYYSTGAKGADWVAVATLAPDEKSVLALVPGDAPGLELLDDWDSAGMRATASGTLVLDGVDVDPVYVVEFWRNFAAPALWPARDGLLHNAVDVGAARTALADAAAYVRDTARVSAPAGAAGIERAADDPHLIHHFGELTARLHAIELLLARGADAIDIAAAASPLTADDVALAFTAADAAKALGGEIAAQIANEVIALGGTAAADDKLNLHRHWRNIRTHTVHDPARWRYHRLGSYVLNGPGIPETA
jgi:alkylation response protein AidB-like acyl-CoA dehydrogenase